MKSFTINNEIAEFVLREFELSIKAGINDVCKRWPLWIKKRHTDEITQEARILALVATESYDSSTGVKFGSWIRIKVGWGLRSWWKNKVCRSLSEDRIPVPMLVPLKKCDSVFFSKARDFDIDLWWEKVLTGVKKRDRQVIIDYFKNGLTMKEIGAKNDLTLSGVSRLLKEGLSQVRTKYEDNCDLSC